MFEVARKKKKRELVEVPNNETCVRGRFPRDDGVSGRVVDHVESFAKERRRRRKRKRRKKKERRVHHGNGNQLWVSPLPFYSCFLSARLCCAVRTKKKKNWEGEEEEDEDEEKKGSCLIMYVLNLD